MNNQINPQVKGICFLIATVASFIASDIFLLLIIWGVILFMFFALNKLTPHFKFVAFAVLPIFLILFFTWGYVLGQAPKDIGGFYINGKLYAIFISLRLIVIGGIFQLVFFSISQEELITHFKSWGLKGNGLIIVLGAFSVFPDLMEKSKRILTARFSRGLVKNRTFFSRIKQLPMILKPLTIEVFSSAIERSESWDDKQMVKRLNSNAIERRNNIQVLDVLFLLISILYLIVSIFLLLR